MRVLARNAGVQAWGGPGTFSFFFLGTDFVPLLSPRLGHISGVTETVDSWLAQENHCP